MFEELSSVTLTHDIPTHNLSKGDAGTVVHVYANGEGYEVEFFNSMGETIAVLTLSPTDLLAVQTNSVVKWIEPIWDGMTSPPSIANNADKVVTRMFYSQL
ncbi:MAG TPA: DUF4926 domain-containing protein [Patescibacteria group bacterium]|nr:DUF4926 domain-containing protein [Patescibacteria group bacterium]